MEESQLKVILDRLDRHESILNRWDRDFDTVWKNNEDVVIQVGNLRNEVTQLREIVRETPKRTSDRVDGIVAEIRQEAQGLKDVLSAKRQIIQGTPNNKKKRRWYFLWIF